tara:strand:- start:277 stop:480 length:204 start_codon:yes stop_codon:yes gene_type:complete
MPDNSRLKVGDIVILKDTNPAHSEEVAGLSLPNYGSITSMDWNDVPYKEVRVSLVDGTTVGGDEITR